MSRMRSACPPGQQDSYRFIESFLALGGRGVFLVVKDEVPNTITRYVLALDDKHTEHDAAVGTR